MTHIAITGASGFLGRHLLASLAARTQVTVHALAHRTPAEKLPRNDNLRWFNADLADAQALADLFVPGATLVNLAYPNQWTADEHLRATAALARRAIEWKVSRVIHCSTAVVVGETSSAVVNEATRARPQTTYQKTKLALEECWREHARGNFDLAILRPTAVFGPHGKNLVKLADALTGGNEVLNYLRSSLFGRRRMSLISVHNVVAAIELLIDYPSPIGGSVYLASDDNEPNNNFRDVEAALAKAFGVANGRLPPLPVPPAVLRAVLRLAGPAKPDPYRIYDSSLLSSCGWQKRCTLADGLSEFAAWYRSGQASSGISR